MHGAVAVLELFVEHDRESLLRVSGDQRTILHYAAAKGQLEVCRWLFDQYPEVYQQLIDHNDRYGRTAIHFAVTSGQLELLQFLLDTGADPTSVDHQGNTPLHLATINGQADMVRLLAQQKDLLTAPDLGGRTPLDWAFSRLARLQQTFEGLPRSEERERSDEIIAALRTAASYSKKSTAKRSPELIDEIAHSLRQLQLQISDPAMLSEVAELCDIFSRF
jgi:hypothetical protein